MTRVDSLVPLTDLGSLILIQTTPKEHSLRYCVYIYLGDSLIVQRAKNVTSDSSGMMKFEVRLIFSIL